MKIDNLAVPMSSQLTALGTDQNNNDSQQQSFGDFLTNAINEVNDQQIQASEMKTKLVTGEINNVHDVLIAVEKADLSFQLTMQVRNKIIEAYQDIMRMQV